MNIPGLLSKGGPTSPTAVRDFLAALSAVASAAANEGDYVFPKPQGGHHGFVQFHFHSDRELIIHRLWASQTGQGSGSFILRTLCALADAYGVSLRLRALPFGREPYPMSRDDLIAWYRRHGFDGPPRRLARQPRPTATGPAAARHSQRQPPIGCRRLMPSSNVEQRAAQDAGDCNLGRPSSGPDFG